MDATETKGIYITFTESDLKAIDTLLEKLNIQLPPGAPRYNRQDFIRMAVAEKLMEAKA